MTALWQRLRLRARDESGAAILEVLVLGVVLFVPLVYLVATLGRIQAGSYAASAAAREGGRLYVTAPSGDVAAGRAQAGARVALGNFSSRGRLTGISCSADPCLTPDAAVTVRSEVVVDLPLIPDFLSGVVPSTVLITAEHTEQVDRFQEPRP